MSHERDTNSKYPSTVNPWLVGRVAFLSATLGILVTLVLVLKFNGRHPASAMVESVESVESSVSSTSFSTQIPQNKNDRTLAEIQPDKTKIKTSNNLLLSHTYPQQSTKLLSTNSYSASIESGVTRETDSSSNSDQNLSLFSKKYTNDRQKLKSTHTSENLTLDRRKVSESLTQRLAQNTQVEQESESEARPEVEEDIEELPNSEELPMEGQRLDLTLDDVVVLALQNNRTLKNAYLDRIIQRQNLEVAEDRFNPNFTPELSFDIEGDRAGSTGSDREVIRLGTGMELLIPTGGRFNVSLRSNRDTRRQFFGNTQSSQSPFATNFEVTFTQPLLRESGTSVNRAPIEMARLQEFSNILGLKSTLIDTITSTVLSYRNLIQSQQQLDIAKRALERAKRDLERTDALIEAGRRARVERVQNETAVANREVSLLTAQNSLESVRLNLIQILDIDQNLVPIAIEFPQNGQLQEITLNAEKLTKFALDKNPRYQQQLIQLEQAQLDLLLAENDQLWNLDLNARFASNLNSEQADGTEWRAGITFGREFGNADGDRAVHRSRINLQQIQNDIQEERETLEIDVRNAIRDVRENFRQVQLARRAKELSIQQLENEKRKLELGEGSIIDVVRFEEDLVNAENGELTATIAYLNALTQLEQTIGTTLDRWNVTVE